MTSLLSDCMCEFRRGCGGTGVLSCTGCGGDQCVCICGGEFDCDGCEDCDFDADGFADDDFDLDPGDDDSP